MNSPYRILERDIIRRFSRQKSAKISNDRITISLETFTKAIQINAQRIHRRTIQTINMGNQRIRRYAKTSSNRIKMSLDSIVHAEQVLTQVRRCGIAIAEQIGHSKSDRINSIMQSIQRIIIFQTTKRIFLNRQTPITNRRINQRVNSRQIAKNN